MSPEKNSGTGVRRLRNSGTGVPWSDPPWSDPRRRDPPYSVVSLHAHPDDEALLTAGTLARACAEGHRVTLVCATDGAMGLVSASLATVGDLAELRSEELRSAAAAIGCTEVRFLGYSDSGYAAPAAHSSAEQSGKPRRITPAPVAQQHDPVAHQHDPVVHRKKVSRVFSEVPVEEAAERLAAILVEVDADVLTIYAPAGGYGHPDHIAVHDVGVAAAELAGTPVVLEATVDRRLLTRMLRVANAVGLVRVLGVDRAEWDPRRFEDSFADPDRITHRVRVGRYARAKRQAMAAHSSQATGDASVRTLAVFARLPLGIFRVVFAKEWFVERGRSPAGRRLDDIFDSVRMAERAHKRSGGRR